MATTTHLCFSPPISVSSVFSHKSQKANFLTPKTSQSRRISTIIRCNTDPLGDFGARDPFPEEIESQFGNKVLGFSDTEHKILIPTASALSLAQQECTVISPDQTPLSDYEARQLLFKVVGWKLSREDGVLKLQCTWKLRDFNCGVELINRIGKVLEGTGHLPTLHQLEQSNQVHAELWTPSIGGLSMNDFIVAAKIDQIKTSDLVPRKRVWA
ncbi:probable pterin-4-alpha-carbinolamine dehydratase, chloroplastic [Lycium barbarum]|uniref:probable pterin-4-alpha-carbinolamine dehydratase, chloroplastic n=1 Tax=Lycium barbarum TaxID=112863 RepID=UPI00293F3929|nr:probable pterin-4-alpha-carbinolamine dehydratase, chloroplastic [Lycium barbarum]